MSLTKIIEAKKKPNYKNEGSAEKLKADFNNQNQVTEYKETNDSINEWKKLKHFFKEYLATSPDDMEFDDAVKKDHRGLCLYFYENLKEKQIISNTFIASDPIKQRTIKLILFNLNIVLYIVRNGLFFSEVYISELYNIKR